MKLSTEERRFETCYAPFVEHYEALARKLYKVIEPEYKKRCLKQGNPLNDHIARKIIIEHLVNKMVITATVKITMEELDNLLE